MLNAPKILSYIFGIVILVVGGTLLYISLSKSPSIEEEKPYQQAKIAKDIKSEQPQKIVIPEIPEVEKIEAQKQINVTNFKKALVRNDESECHEIDDIHLRSQCFDRTRLEAALQNHQLELCSAISDMQNKIYCQDEILSMKALNTKNPNLCLQISQESKKDSCVAAADTEIFLAATNMSTCKKIRTPEHKNTCLDHFRLLQIKEASSEDFCLDFSTSQGQEKCMNYFYNKQAITLKDPTICLQISNVTEQQRCEESMKALLQKTELSQGLLEGKSEQCADFVDYELKKQCEDEANYYAAKIYKNAKYCDKIQNSTFQQRCIHNLQALTDEYWQTKAQEEEQSDYCKNLSSEAGIEYCLNTLES